MPLAYQTGVWTQFSVSSVLYVYMSIKLMFMIYILSCQFCLYVHNVLLLKCGHRTFIQLVMIF